jgi:hypothetical protein
MDCIAALHEHKLFFYPQERTLTFQTVIIRMYIDIILEIFSHAQLELWLKRFLDLPLHDRHKIDVVLQESMLKEIIQNRHFLRKGSRFNTFARKIDAIIGTNLTIYERDRAFAFSYGV